MRKVTFLILLALVAQALSPSLTFAHGDHGDGNAVLSEETVRALHEHLSALVTAAIRRSTPESDAEARAVGEFLLDAVYDDVVADLKEHEPGRAAVALGYLKTVVKSFNPVALGRWLLETARRKGPGIAIAYGVSEVVEQLGVLLAARYHELAFLVPLSLTHTSDAIVLGLIFGLPRALRLVSLWSRFGGLAAGPDNYYRHLLEQRARLPIDWSVVIDVSTLRLAAADGASEDALLAVIREGFIERHLPRALRVRFSPRGLAQRETVPTFSTAELERIASRSGVALRPFRAFRAEPAVYSRMLLREIARSEEASAWLAAETRIRHEKASVGALPSDTNAWGRARLLDAEELLAARTPEELQNVATQQGETPDLIAQRVLWHLESQLKETEEQLEELEARPKAERPSNLWLIQRGYRAIDALLAPDGQLARTAASRFTEPAFGDWVQLHNVIRKATGAHEALIDLLPPRRPERCEALLLGA